MSENATLLAPRVVIVEDEALIAEEIQDRLQRLGYHVVGRADTGESAIRTVLETRPDLVLMDIRLKGKMDGIEASEQIRRQCDVPVVYLTAHSDKATLARARASAPFGFVLKPFQERDLLVSIEMGLQRHGVELRLRESEARYATTLASIQDGVISTDMQGQVTFMNPVAEQLTGWPMGEARGRPVEQVLVLQREHDRRAEPNPMLRVLEQRKPVHLAEPMLLVDRSGDTLVFEDSAAPILDSKGKMRGAVMAFRDGRPRRKAEETLRRVEEQLLHAQKMEAIGRLASGVAHDFNNIVTTILGNGELLLASERLDPALVARVEGILRSGERAAELASKLLVYSRRQVLVPEVVDLGELVADIEELVRRLIGADVELRRQGFPGALPVCVDRGQVEQVILNLVVNARDAMPSGGVLVLETFATEVAGGEPGEGELAPGSYALLVVTDSGVGMDEGTQAHLFEPFFTTKPAGIGTGLGLATVYGIVKQSGGHVEIDSSPGHGTAVSIYLPAAEQPAAPQRQRATPAAVPRGNETILVVEDDAAVRAIAALTLESFGYSVLSAASPAEALNLCAQTSAPLQLLLTDVVLPGMSGCELAAKLLAEARVQAVLYLSGYPDEVLAERGLGELQPCFLQKPFTPSGLARKVRELLDA